MYLVEKRIAQFMLSNSEKVINMTVRQLSNEIDVSEGSIIRFANKLGFDGFTKLKINIAKNSSPNSGVLFGGSTQKSSIKAVMEEMKHSIFYSIENTIAAVDEDEFANIANILMSSKRIEFYGVGSSLMIALDGYYRFLRMGLPAYAVTDSHISTVSAYMLDKDSAVIGISYSGKSLETLKAMEMAKKRGAKTIGITAYSNSRLAKMCDEVIISIAKETEYYQEATAARLSQLMILDSLSLYIARRKKKSLEVMGNVIDILGEHRI